MKKLLLASIVCMLTACGATLPGLKYPDGKNKIPVNSNSATTQQNK